MLHSIFCISVLLLTSPHLIGATNDYLSNLLQTPIIRSWGTQDGLPQNTVTAIAQSPDGYLWLGTHGGLARFDGVRFTVFDFKSGLPGMDVSCLMVDHQGVLWIGTEGAGLCCMRGTHIETISDLNPQAGSDSITYLQEDSKGRLWVGTSGGLRFCQDGKLIEDPQFVQLSHAVINGLLLSRDNTTMWVSSALGGLMSYSNGCLTSCQGPVGYENFFAECLYEDREGRLWVGIGNGTVLCRHKNGHWHVYNENDGLPFALVTSMTEDNNGTIWAGSLDDGLYRLQDEHFNRIGRSGGLSAEDICSLFCDRGNNLWVGTRSGGLNQLKRRNLMVADVAQGLTNDYTRSVAQTPDGALWVGTIGGSLYRGTPSKFEPFRPQYVSSLIHFYPFVDSVSAMPDGSLWWGCSGALMHWKNNHLADCYTNEPWLHFAAVTALQNDNHNGIWIGTSHGKLLHLQNGRFNEHSKQFARAAITSLIVQADGSLWIGDSSGGIKYMRKGTDQVLSISSQLASPSIRTLYLDGDGTLWIGTAGGGLNCWRNGTVKNFTASEGLTMRTVSQIVEDDDGFLWLGCNSGIFKASKKDLLACAAGRLAFVHCRSFGINDGMLATECSGGFCPAGLKTKSGLICISTVRGLVFINPKQNQQETPPPKALFEEMLVNGKPQSLTAAGKNKNNSNPQSRLVIAPGNRDVELRYTAIGFSAPEKIGFRYKLDGLDGAWTEALARRTAFYQHIPPGRYTFHVEACNADGDWNNQDATLAVTVLPFFWETAWFRIGVTFVLLSAFASILSLIVRGRYKRRLANLQTLNAVERERLRISKDMHDHVGGMLTQMSQISDMGQDETDNQTLVKHRFERIGNQSRVAVRALDEIVWATNPRNDNLASFAEYVSRFCDEFFEYTNIRCWQEVPSDFPARTLRADIRHNVFLAVQEAFNNALKHSKCTEIWLRMKLNDTQVTLEIEDNGLGFTPDNVEPGGNGLGNMQARLSEDNGKTIIVSAPGKGTRIRFIFPIGP